MAGDGLRAGCSKAPSAGDESQAYVSNVSATDVAKVDRDVIRML
jgi:hypothetical protein